MVRALSVESGERHWKINSITEDVQCMKRDYVDLKQRAELLIKMSDAESDENALCEEHADDTNELLGDIRTCLDETKECLEEVEGFFHPCGDSGWHQVVHFDMSVPGTECPDGWTVTTVQGVQTCANMNPDTCAPAVYPTFRSYNQVCGRVHGYSLGDTGGFGEYYDAGGNPSISVENLFVTGVIITRGTDEHVFSFISGSSPVAAATNQCPCLTNEDEFETTAGTLPDFLNGEYFCETSTSDNTIQTQVSLWDGLNCAPGSNCCENGAPPYFTKVLETDSTEGLQFNLCHAGNDATTTVHLMEIYVKL